MKKSILFLVIALGFISISAQTDDGKANQTSAIEEVQKISLEVVKLFNEKRYDEALPIAQKVIAIRENVQGKNHVDVAPAWRNLGFIQMRRGKLEEAEDAFRRVVKIFESSQSLSVENEKIFAEMLEAVGLYEAFDADYYGAEKKLKRAIELSEKINGKDAFETANPIYKLAQIYQVQDKYENAAPLLLRALDIKTKKNGKLDEQSKGIYSRAYCALSKLDRKDERTKLREKFYPKKDEKNSDVETQPRTINSGVVNGKAISLVKPAYPKAARDVRAKGSVKVEVEIDEAGRIVFACAVSGAKELQQASENAAYQSKFLPTTLDGEAVKVTGIIVYNYTP